ncbi:MAG: hypothetical protein QOF67_267 [Mycobacterium sp.]|jgi:hypothetical protein|nr:hypothetical protein [Mycobacterium sp.]MDT5207852.1 hypothetical protein [Mycobacterium sp.]
MPALAPPVTSDRDAVLKFLAYHQSAFFPIAFGLTDDQARSTPSVSSLSIGGLIKHATGVQRGWMQRVTSAPDVPPRDDRPFEVRAAEYQDEYVMREDEKLSDLLDALGAQNADTLRLLGEADFDTPVPVPRDAPWFPSDIDNWSIRWVAFHLINELARHSGHADIIRESIDGATMYDLIAGLEDWPETDWIKPWKPASV